MKLKAEYTTSGEFWSDKLMDLANLSVVVLVFGQLVTEKIEWVAVIFGVGLYIGIGVICQVLRRR